VTESSVTLPPHQEALRMGAIDSSLRTKEGPAGGRALDRLREETSAAQETLQIVDRLSAPDQRVRLRAGYLSLHQQTEILGFLDPYGADTGRRWRPFLLILERGLQTCEQKADAVKGALNTFAFANACLRKESTN